MIKTFTFIALSAIFILTFSKRGISQTFSFDEDIEITVEYVNEDSINNYIQHLENYVTRFMIAPNRLEIAKWLEGKFQSFGLDSVRIDTFSTHTTNSSLGIDTTTKQYNVIATIPGSSKRKIIICGHYDSFAYGDPFTTAPGADDDASGIAACLESARIFSEIDYNPEHTIEIVAFAAEELMNYGLGGYDIYAADSESRNDTIDLVLHNDMIGYNDGNRSVYLSTYPGCESETALVAFVCENYTDLNRKFWPSTMGPFADRAFYNRGYKSVYIEENFDANPNYHLVTDLLSNMDVNFCAEVTKVSIGASMQFDIKETTSVNELSEKINFSVYPIPVTSTSVIDYNLNESCYIELALYDLLGRKVKTIEKGDKKKGIYTVELNKNNLEGIFLLSLNINNKYRHTKKILID